MVSVIVPVFNAEKYLQDTIDSVLNQSYSDWELILVDDGSTDSSPEICHKAALSSERIKVISQTNQGPSAARNKGTECSSGEYITFLDADDLLPPYALTALTAPLSVGDADIICGDIKEIPADTSLSSLTHSFRRDIPSYTITGLEAVKDILYQREISNSACGKLFSADLVKKVKFEVGIGYEDLAFTPAVFIKAARVKRIPATIYLYRQHPDSYIHTFSLRRADVLSVTANLSDSLFRDCPEVRKAARARELNANFNIYGLISANIATLHEEDKIKALLLKEQCRDKIKELRSEALRNPSVRLKTKIGILLSYIGGFPSLTLLSKFLY